MVKFSKKSMLENFRANFLKLLLNHRTEIIYKYNVVANVMFLHTGSAMGCLPECQISCTGVCIPACCAATPIQLPVVYSSSMAPRQPGATMYQCPYPCPNACAPACSLKCCNSVYHVSPLYLRRKRIWRKRKKHNLRRALYLILGD